MAGGKNCLISIPSYGKTYVWVESIVHGLNIFTFGPENSQESRTRRQFFTSHRTSGSFTLDLIFTSHDSREQFLSWLEGYARWAGNPSTNSTSVRVVVPSRGFDKMGVLDGALAYGDEVGKVLYQTRIGFMGGRDPLDLDTQAGLSTFIGYQEDENNREVDNHGHTLVRLYPNGSASNSLYRWDEAGTVIEDDLSPIPRHGKPQ